MILEMTDGIYRLEIPLPGNPLKAVNSYVIPGERNLIIDTGLNRSECRQAMEDGLKALSVDLGKTDFFITHVHADHFALAPVLASEESRIYFNVPDADRLGDPARWEAMGDYARHNGFPEEELKAAVYAHPGYKYGSQPNRPLVLLGDGDLLRAGPYSLRCVETPGHTRGHLCLYEEQAGILFSGDHILGDITPNIQCWSEEDDPLEDYLRSLTKTAGLQVKQVFPGHRRPMDNCRGRIEELKLHHRSRAQEVLTILEKGAQNGYGVASRMTWDLTYKSWQDFPVSQKWFATGEALAHLRYLENKGQVTRTSQNGQFLYIRA